MRSDDAASAPAEPPAAGAGDEDHRERAARPRTRRRGRRLAPLSFRMRAALLAVGWVLVLVGVAGLALPGIQGILTIVVGAAILSLVSETTHRWLRRAFRRWPRGWQRVERLRRRIHRRLSGGG